MHIQLETSQVRLQLQRLPYHKNDTLQAWDAADSYLLQHLVQQDIPPLDSHIVIINDGFGALALGLQAEQMGLDGLVQGMGRADAQVLNHDSHRHDLLWVE